MSSSAAGKHAASGAARPAVAEPTFAEHARTLVYLGRVGTLSTLSRKLPGFPFGSVMPYGLDDHANPIFSFSAIATHIHDVQTASIDSQSAANPFLLGNRSRRDRT
jgi:hypothetical protein